VIELRPIYDTCRACRSFRERPALLPGAGPAAKPQPDVLIFTDGEKLIGQFKSAKGASVVFKSDMAGELTVPWSKIQELRTSRPFAVIGKNVSSPNTRMSARCRKATSPLTTRRSRYNPRPARRARSPWPDAGFVVAQPDFEKAMNRADGLFQDWAGSDYGGSQRGRGHPGCTAPSREPFPWCGPSLPRTG